LDGALVVDKPAGLTSHDVVARARRAVAERRIGHTGTLDPLATGVLPLVCGRATRLAQFLLASDKEYEAEIRFGLSTDTFDVTGNEVARSDRIPERDVVVAALDTLRGEYLQTPPPYSAKKIAGRRAYELARRETPVDPPPAPVSVSALHLIELEGSIARLHVTCSSGFYVRSLARDLGDRVGTGACLQALRRTRSGEFSLQNAVTLERLERDTETALRSLLPMDRLLPWLPMITVTAEGLTRISHGREIGQPHISGPMPERSATAVRLMGADGSLLAVATSGTTPGSLHPSVVLI
jgi:tRNA pseudouridine55 synthase